MNIEGMDNVPSADDAEIRNLEMQGWERFTASADEAQRNMDENDLIQAGYQVQVFLNPDNKTYTIMRKAPAEDAYSADYPVAAEEGGPESVSNTQRDKMHDVFPGLFGNPEDENQNKAA